MFHINTVCELHFGKDGRDESLFFAAVSENDCERLAAYACDAFSRFLGYPLTYEIGYNRDDDLWFRRSFVFRKKPPEEAEPGDAHTEQDPCGT